MVIVMECAVYQEIVSSGYGGDKIFLVEGWEHLIIFYIYFIS